MKADVAEMILHEGLYICGDIHHPTAIVPITSLKGQLHSMQLDVVIDPERFLDTAIIQGPYLLDLRVALPTDAQLARDHWTIEAMMAEGGSFVRSLGECAMRADYQNLSKIKAAWPEYWRAYEARGHVLEQSEKKS